MNKRIFKFFDGSKDVFADPVYLERRWFELSQQIDIHTELDKFYGPDFVQNIINGVCCDQDGKPLPNITPEMIKFAESQRREALGSLIPIFYEMFGLKPIDRNTGEGTNEDEIVDIWYHYQEYVYEVKKNTEMTQNSQPSIPEPSSEQPTPQTIPTTQNMNESAVSDGTRNVL